MIRFTEHIFRAIFTQIVENKDTSEEWEDYDADRHELLN